MEQGACGVVRTRFEPVGFSPVEAVPTAKRLSDSGGKSQGTQYRWLYIDYRRLESCQAPVPTGG